MEGIEPSVKALQAPALPLGYIPIGKQYYNEPHIFCQSYRYSRPEYGEPLAQFLDQNQGNIVMHRTRPGKVP